jgi:hypothetical protein
MPNASEPLPPHFNEHTRPHPLYFLVIPSFCSIVSIAAPFESKPFTIAAAIVLAMQFLFAIYIWLLNPRSKRMYNFFLIITTVLTSVICLIPGLKISFGPFWTAFLLIYWLIFFFVSFCGERFFPSRKFPMGFIIIICSLFIILGRVVSNGAAGPDGTVYVSLLDDEHILVTLFGKEIGWDLAAYLYSITMSSFLLMFQKR